MSIPVKKKRTVKPKVSTRIEDELQLIINEMEDVDLTEPISGSPFIRRGFVECIDDINYERLLITGKTYRVNELHGDGNKLYITCEDGDNRWVPDTQFKAIDYGPFKPQDQVQLNGWANVEVISGEMDNGLRNVHGSVESGDDQYAIVLWGRNHKFKIPNANLRLMKRHLQLGVNPFKPGDRVRAVKDSQNIHVGCLYIIQQSYDDYVHVIEDNDHRHYHTVFKKYDRLSKKEKIKALQHKSLTLQDYIRKFFNEHSYEALTPSKLYKYMKDSKVPKEFLNEEEIVQAVKLVNKSLFHW